MCKFSTMAKRPLKMLAVNFAHVNTRRSHDYSSTIESNERYMKTSKNQRLLQRQPPAASEQTSAANGLVKSSRSGFPEALYSSSQPNKPTLWPKCVEGVAEWKAGKVFFARSYSFSPDSQLDPVLLRLNPVGARPWRQVLEEAPNVYQ